MLYVSVMFAHWCDITAENADDSSDAQQVQTNYCRALINLACARARLVIQLLDDTASCIAEPGELLRSFCGVSSLSELIDKDFSKRRFTPLQNKFIVLMKQFASGKVNFYQLHSELMVIKQAASVDKIDVDLSMIIAFVQSTLYAQVIPGLPKKLPIVIGNDPFEVAAQKMDMKDVLRQLQGHMPQGAHEAAVVRAFLEGMRSVNQPVAAASSADEAVPETSPSE